MNLSIISPRSILCRAIDNDQVTLAVCTPEYLNRFRSGLFQYYTSCMTFHGTDSYCLYHPENGRDTDNVIKWTLSPCY